jgi:hypothetical protein
MALGLCERALVQSLRDALDLCKKGTYMGNIWIFDCMRRVLDLNGGGGDIYLTSVGKHLT